jgi:hypothetical protein
MYSEKGFTDAITEVNRLVNNQVCLNDLLDLLGNTQFKQINSYCLVF